MNSAKSWKKTFFTIWAGQAVSLLTSSVVQFAILWYLTDTTRSPTVLSIAFLAAFLPQGILGLFIGVYIDRWDRKKIMMISDSCIALACLTIVVAGMFSELPVWLFFIVLMIRSIGAAFHEPSLSAATPLIVPAGELTKCAGYSQTIQSVSFILSPALAGMLYSSWSLESIVFLDVIGAFVGVGTLAFCSIPKVNVKRTKRPQVLLEMREGMQAIQAQKGLTALLIVCALFSLAFSPIGSLYPLMSMDFFGGGAREASIVETAFSVGYLGGSLLLGKWGGFKKKTISIAMSAALAGASIAISGLVPVGGFYIFVILSGVLGVPCPFFSGVSAAVFQEKVAPEYLGRVMSLYGSVLTLSIPFGLAVATIASEIIGLNHWFVIAGTAICIFSALFLLIPSLRELE